ncbi:MAG: hypothetical protein ACOX4M_08820 [Acetivibrionales bacterium]
MERIMRLPLLLGFLAAVITGAVSYAAGARQPGGMSADGSDDVDIFSPWHVYKEYDILVEK